MARTAKAPVKKTTTKSKTQTKKKTTPKKKESVKTKAKKAVEIAGLCMQVLASLVGVCINLQKLLV